MTYTNLFGILWHMEYRGHASRASTPPSTSLQLAYEQQARLPFSLSVACSVARQSACVQATHGSAWLKAAAVPTPSRQQAFRRSRQPGVPGPGRQPHMLLVSHLWNPCLKLFSPGISARVASVCAWQGTPSQPCAQAHQDQDRNMTMKDVDKLRRSRGLSACTLVPGIAV